jgi:hypothetical protein
MKSVAFTLAAVLSSAAAFAQQGQTYTPSSPNTPPPASTSMQQTPSSAAPSVDVGAIFDKLNSSHTGKLTKAEAQAQPTVAANFEAADSNHDGVLTKDEFLAAFKPAQ